MAETNDPTLTIREAAAALPEVATGTSCNQNSFKAGKASFLFIGPGAKGIGFKAMFKLGDSLPQAEQLARKEPTRFQVGSTKWVTVRFSAEEPLAKSIWRKWLNESYAITTGASGSTSQVRKKK